MSNVHLKQRSNRMRILLGLRLLLICSVVLLLREIAFAQAGSTGGTIGNTDKSVSGGEERHTRGPSKPGEKVRSVPEGKGRPAVYHAAIKQLLVLHKPTINGMRVDWCMTSDLSECGDVSASTLCRSNGLTYAVGFKLSLNSRTYRQGSRDICQGMCAGFFEVECE